MKKIFKYLFLSNIMLLLNFEYAYSYLDPGTGSLVLQAIIGFLSAALAGFIYCWTGIKKFFLNLFKKKNNDKKPSN